MWFMILFAFFLQSTIAKTRKDDCTLQTGENSLTYKLIGPGSKNVWKVTNSSHGRSDTIVPRDLGETICRKQGFEPWVPTSMADVIAFTEFVTKLESERLMNFTWVTGIMFRDGWYWTTDLTLKLDDQSFHAFFSPIEGQVNQDPNSTACVLISRDEHGYYMRDRSCDLKTDNVLDYMVLCQFPEASNCYSRSIEEKNSRKMEYKVKLQSLFSSSLAEVVLVNRMMSYYNAKTFCKNREMRMVTWDEVGVYGNTSIYHLVANYKVLQGIPHPFPFWVNVDKDWGSEAGEWPEPEQDKKWDDKCIILTNMTLNDKPFLRKEWCNKPFNVVCIKDC